MFATLLEFGGLALIADGTRVLVGNGYALLVAGGALLIVGAGADDVHPVAFARGRWRARKIKG